MSYTRLVLTAGFAMFAMFFGSGNLVFPLMVGVISQSNFQIASMGLVITGVAVPFLGLLGMLYYSGNRHLFFKTLGKPLAFILTFAMLGLLGPFAVVPRCTIVAHGGITLIAPFLSPVFFNAVFLGITLVLAWKKTRIIEIIGTFLTPWLLGGIIAIIVAGLLFGPEISPSLLKANQAFTTGLSKGYQTMDLLAAFFFSAATVAFIAKALTTHKDKQNLEKLSVTACLIGAFLLTVVYLGFVALGAKFALLLHGIDPEKLLVVIAQQSLGNLALPIAAVIIGLACLTTAAILTSLFADFLHKDILRERIPRHVALIATILLSYTLSLVGFVTLASWIAFALEIVYPALIVFSIVAIFHHKTQHRFEKYHLSKISFGLVIAASLYVKFFTS
ncbi:MAG TPA: hypothetical protein DD412_05815 [Holosporales bacterium]|nr:hypothetical protein [Holosporales bacterium]